MSRSVGSSGSAARGGAFGGPIRMAARVAGAAVFGICLVSVWRGDPFGLDAKVEAWVRDHRPEDGPTESAMRAITRLGNPELAIPLVCGATLGIAALSRGGPRRALRAAAWFALAVLLSNATNAGLKRIVDRPRPPEERRLVSESSPSFPSGHSAFAGSYFGALAVIFARAARRRGGIGAPFGWFAAAACAAMALLVAGSRVWLGVHHPTDVVAGLLWGAMWVDLWALGSRSDSESDPDRDTPAGGEPDQGPGSTATTTLPK